MYEELTIEISNFHICSNQSMSSIPSDEDKHIFSGIIYVIKLVLVCPSSYVSC